jgi:hypothetical protein
VANLTSVQILKSGIEQPSSNSNLSRGQEKLILKGEAFDVGSGINNVKVRISDKPFVVVNQTNHGQWLNWQADLWINSNDNNTLVIKSEDNAKNVEYMTLLGKMESLVK